MRRALSIENARLARMSQRDYVMRAFVSSRYHFIAASSLPFVYRGPCGLSQQQVGTRANHFGHVTLGLS